MAFILRSRAMRSRETELAPQVILLAVASRAAYETER